MWAFFRVAKNLWKDISLLWSETITCKLWALPISYVCMSESDFLIGWLADLINFVNDSLKFNLRLYPFFSISIFYACFFSAEAGFQFFSLISVLFVLSSLQPWSGFQAFIIICFVYMHVCFSFGQVSSFCFTKVWKSDVCGYYFCRKNLRVQNFMNLICFSNTHSDIHHFKFQCTTWYG